MQITPFGIYKNTDTLQLLWSGSGFRCICEGDVTFTFASKYEEGYEAYLAYYQNNIPQHTYKLTSSLTVKLSFSSPTPIEFLKITERQYGSVCLTHMSGHISPLPVEKKLKILWIGDSLSAGYGIFPDKSDIFTTSNEDIRESYTYKTTNLLDMQGYYVVYSGNGIVSRYVEPDVNVPNTDEIMPSFFPLSFALDPDVICVNLGTNDASYTRNIKERELLYKEKYIHFVDQLKTLYPKSVIVLCYGMMETSLLPYVRDVAKCCDVLFTTLKPIHPEDKIGVIGHPSYQTHTRTSQYLTAYLKEVIAYGK